MYTPTCFKTIRFKGIKLCLLLVLLFPFHTSQSQNSAVFKEKFTEGPALILTVGSYKIRFAERMSWTYRDVSFNDKRIFGTTGAHQPVIRERNTPQGADIFLGSGHRKETIESVAIAVIENGKETARYPINTELDIDFGDSYVFYKNSLFLSEFNGLFYKHQAKISVSPDGIEEEYTFDVAGDDLSSVDYMYMFMHIFPGTTTTWLAGDDNKVVDEGVFLTDNSYSLKRDIRFLMVFDSEQELGVAIAYPCMYEGSSWSNAFINRKQDNKHYFKIDPKRSVGDSFKYSATIKAFDLYSEDGKEEGEIVIEDLLGKLIKF